MSVSVEEVQRLRFIDLFAGAGGLSIGFETAGLEAIAAVEIDSDSADTYRLWHERPERLRTGRAVPKIHEADLANVDLSQYRGEADLIVGGPPCQPWSLGGLRKGHADSRDGLYLFHRALLEVQPNAFVMENVAGLTKGSTRADFLGFIETLRAQEHWDVHWRVLQAADHGVPQKRERLFVVGLPPGSAFAWPRRSFGPDRSREWKSAGDALRSVTPKTVNATGVTYAKSPSLRPNPYHGQVYNGGGRPIDLDAPSPTLLASMGGNKTPWIDAANVVPGYHEHLRSGGTPRSGEVPGARRISVEEAAALQTFPPTMTFSGTQSSRYRQIGNAVPPVLGLAVGRAVNRSVEP